MTPAQLEQLAQLSQIKRDADAAQLRTIQAEERKIRANLAALDTRQESTRDLPAADTLTHRRVGGDILWHVWVGRRRRELQMQLARCLAQKGVARHHLQKSFGKNSALTTLRGEAQARSDHAKKIDALDRVTEISVLRHAR